jgi:hypothetical protein
MVLWLITQLVLAAVLPAPAPEEGFYIELVDDSFSAPLFVTAPTGDRRLFVVERGGKVKVVIDDQVLATPYLDVGHLLPTSPGSEQGLLGLAFHPDFTTNGKLYLSYTDSAGRLAVAQIVANPNANTASLGSLKTVIRINEPFSNHNGGMVLFGPDRMLYVGVGDGGGGGDPQGNGQNKKTLLGTLLRIDVDSDAYPADFLRNYAIPSDNPFVGTTGADEIWVYGLRNPWRFWIDPPTGRLYIADVGQNAREEITILEPGSEGSNMGWNILEGTRCYPSGGSCSATGTVLPQVEYPHSGRGASITGGIVYRGSTTPQLYGVYFYADFIAGWVRSFRYDGTVEEHTDWVGVLDTSLVSSFGVDGRGEMYIVSLAGPVWRFRGPPLDDEMFFYMDSGLFRYYDIGPDGRLGSPILGGTGYSPGWDAITAISLD